MIREYMDKQKELRRKQLEFDRDCDKVVKCEPKSYYPLVVRKYMIEKKKKLQQKQLLDTDNDIKIYVKESGNKTQENNNNNNNSVQNDSN
jgi:hypothetical protein